MVEWVPVRSFRPTAPLSSTHAGRDSCMHWRHIYPEWQGKYLVEVEHEGGRIVAGIIIEDGEGV
jgi:hypothetical protein